MPDGKTTLTNLPLTTKSGLKIGRYYTPPQKIQMSRDDEFWQGVLLGIKPVNNIPIVICVIGLLVLVKFLMEFK